ncbi:MAG: AGE family epimerase/isomerase [Anaerolineae bacterium]|nr:AGE family epimerase/isomerase [Anaerolineae bacterium]
MDLSEYRNQIIEELTGNILPFDINHAVDRKHGGFYGWISNTNWVLADRPKGAVQHARMLWMYSLAFRKLSDPVYREMADHAYNFMLKHIWDPVDEGLLWLVTPQGDPHDTSKFAYAQAFGIYGLAEYYRATGTEEALQKAVRLWELVEEHFYDPDHGGYFEGGTRDWTRSSSVSLDDTGFDKTMNTNLHMLEAYTNLLRVYDDTRLRDRLRQLIELILDRILDRETGHFRLLFDREWRADSVLVSFGHDIEGSWLLCESADVLGDQALIGRVRKVALHMADRTCAEGRAQDGSLYNEGLDGQIVDPIRIWWVEAEAVVGFLNAYQLSGDRRYLDASLACWEFIQNQIVDRENGGWFWGVDDDYQPLDFEKAGPWKTSYHSGRACFEIAGRIEALADDPV